MRDGIAEYSVISPKSTHIVHDVRVPVRSGYCMVATGCYGDPNGPRQEEFYLLTNLDILHSRKGAFCH